VLNTLFAVTAHKLSIFGIENFTSIQIKWDFLSVQPRDGWQTKAMVEGQREECKPRDSEIEM